MKTTDNTEVLITSKNLESTAFSLTVNATAFDILANGLYSNKPLAIIRELACNGYDSHVAAKQDKPFVVTLPTITNPTLEIEDFGIGMSDFDIRGGVIDNITNQKISAQEIEQFPDIDYETDRYQRQTGIFNTFFCSTKSESNDFIGQMGLGCKSPYSYSNSFIVVSVFNNTKNTYFCFKDEQRIPAISLMHSEQTDQHNGMRITIPVDHNDCHLFVQAAKRCLVFFDNPPIVIDQDQNRIEIDHVNFGDQIWKWKTEPTSKSVCTIVQGGVGYDVDPSILISNNAPTADRAILYGNLYIKVPIGTVSSAASREHLQYDQTTIGNLLNVVNQVEQQVHQYFKQIIETSENWYQATITHYKLTNLVPYYQTYRAICNNYDYFKHNNIRINGMLTFTYPLQNTECYKITKFRRQVRRTTVVDENQQFALGGIDNNTKFYFALKKTVPNSELLKMLDDIDSFILFIPQSSDPNTISAEYQQLKDLFDQLGIPLSTINKKVTDRKSRAGIRQRIDDQFYLFCPEQYSAYYRGKDWKLTKIEENTVYYIPTTNKKHELKKSSLITLLYYGNVLNLFDDTKVFGLSKLDINKLKQRKVNLINVIELAIETVQKYQFSEAITTAYPSVDTIEMLFSNEFITMLPNIATQQETIFNQLTNVIRQAKTQENNKFRNSILQLAKILNIELKFNHVLTDSELTEIKNQIYTKYRLIKYLFRADINDVNQYIEMIDTTSRGTNDET